MIVKTHRWQQTALAAAVCLALWQPDAMALSLGRITVLSALGEPLRAEVEIPDINADEAASLKAAVASPASFKAAGIDYNAAMSNLQASLHKRADGRTYIRLSGDRAINDPFVDLVIEASWASGRIVRDYTLLFDPPNLHPTPTPAPNPAQLAAPRPAERPAPSAPVPVATRAAEPMKVAPQAGLRAPAATTPGSTNGTISVKPGDTASKIASATKPASISLDQMLVALLRLNPTAFMDDNVNRIKAGSVMTIPSTAQAEATPVAQATQIIIAQSKDFNEFRRRLALGAPNAALSAADRNASGNVQAKLEDQRVSSSAPDKLTLSKGAIQKQQTEDQLAAQRAAQDAAKRAAELAQNISDLSKLGAASNTVTPGAMEAASVPAQAAVATVAPPTSAPTAAVAPVLKRPAALPAPAAKSSLIDDILENPMLPVGAGAVIALLALLGFYRARQRRQASEGDKLAPEVRLHPDSFFGASGGQRVDTNDSVNSSPAIAYSPSQLGAAEEVDPVAEADVYLAYGRDFQAEEILKDALRSSPARLAIHQKLLELFAKRRDLQSFQATAELAYAACGGQGPEWERMRELGQSIDPGNALYRSGGQATTAVVTPALPTHFEPDAAPAEVAASPAAQMPDAASAGAVDIDLDLDFSIDEAPADAAWETADSLAETTPGLLDLDLNLAGENTETRTPERSATRTNADTNSIDFTLPDLPPEAPTPQLTAPKTPKFDMLEFDLSALSLDLDDVPTPDSTPTAELQANSMATKLALAEEFQAIGDADGARALIEEVIAQASGDMKAKAQRALSQLSSA